MVSDRDVKNSPKEVKESGKESQTNVGLANLDRIALLQDHQLKPTVDRTSQSLPGLELTQAGRVSDRSSFNAMPHADTPARVLELKNLPHNSGQRSGVPDAMVRLPQNFDPAKPINIVVYNHGFGDTAKSSFTNANLSDQMASAPPNTVLVAPEWQRSPAARSGDQGNFSKAGTFKGMLQDIFARTPELQGKSLNDVGNIGIISHSAGYNPSMSEIYNNGLGDKVKSVTLLDSLYNGTGFDRWVKDNIQDLAAGKKQFTNVFMVGGTESASKAEAGRVKQMLAQAGLSQSSMLEDYQHSNQVMDANQFAGHSIIFKSSNATTGKLSPHMSLPNMYVSKVEGAAALRQPNTPGDHNSEPLPNPIPGWNQHRPLPNPGGDQRRPQPQPNPGGDQRRPQPQPNPGGDQRRPQPQPNPGGDQRRPQPQPNPNGDQGRHPGYPTTDRNGGHLEPNPWINDGSEKPNKPVPGSDKPEPSPQPGRDGQQPAPQQAAINDARNTLESPDATIKQKMAAINSLYSSLPKDNNGRVQVELSDNGQKRSFEIATQSMGNGTNVVEMFGKGNDNNLHPVLRFVDRNGKIEQQRDSKGAHISYKGDWWSQNAQDSNIAKYGSSTQKHEEKPKPEVNPTKPEVDPKPRTNPNPEVNQKPRTNPSPEVAPKPNTNTNPEVNPNPRANPNPEVDQKPRTNPNPEVNQNPGTSRNPEVNQNPANPNPGASPNPGDGPGKAPPLPEQLPRTNPSDSLPIPNAVPPQQQVAFSSLLADDSRLSIGQSKYRALDGNTPSASEGCASTVSNLIYETAKKAGIELPYREIHDNQVKGLQAKLKAGLFEKNGVHAENVDAAHVQPGDIVFGVNRKAGFGTSRGANHIGIVTRVENGQIYVANNHSGVVKEDHLMPRYAGYNQLSFMHLNMNGDAHPNHHVAPVIPSMTPHDRPHNSVHRQHQVVHVRRRRR